ncbi:MAG: PilZ domain-containing protein [Anaerolineae bacterium]
MQPGQRRYPRFDFGGAGEVRVPLGQKPGYSRIPVQVNTLSYEGAGVAVLDEKQLTPGTVVELAFEIDGAEVGMLARVVWAAGGRAGMQIHVKTLGAEQKRVFSNWIVPRTREALKKTQN